MKKKHAPEQYAAKPKAVAVKPNTTLSVHPAVGVSKGLVSWLERGGVPPSVILLHGLHLARSPETDGLPVDTYRPHLKMQGADSKVISEILDALARPQSVKTRVIAEWLQSIWVKKSAGMSQTSSSQTNKLSAPPRKSQGFSSAKPVIVVKKKRETGMGTA
jgi:transcriptional regulator with XRE-family HTH domain